MKYTKKTAFEAADAFGIGAPNDTYAQYFIGQSFLKPLTEPEKAPVFLANVTFEPRCRNNWHIHHATKGGGQILICTAGEGWYQEEGKPAVSLKGTADPGAKSDHEDPAVGQVFDGGFSEKRAIHIIFQKDRKLGPFV